jgi:hypothetical protein
MHSTAFPLSFFYTLTTLAMFITTAVSVARPKNDGNTMT